MTLKQKIALTLLAGAVAAVGGLTLSTARADQIQLKDGRTVNGAMHRDGPAVVIKTDAGETIMTTPDQVMRVTLTSDLTPAQAAEAAWNHTAFLIGNSTDLAAIIALHQAFLDKYPDQEISAGVRNSMGEYQKLQRQGAIKFRGRWMPAAEIETTLRTWHDNARPALELYHVGKIREAFDAAKKTVLADAQNPDALTIAGLSAFRLNNLTASRYYFTQLVTADPSSPLAENNLAVIAAQQNSFAQSLVHYTRALQSAPGNRLVLDNIEEALAAYDLAKGDKQNNAYRDLMRQFNQAEARMEADLARKNLYRYGSTWVSKDELSRLTATTASVQAAMTRLDAQYASARQSLSIINAQITQATNDYNAALASVNSLNDVVNGSNRAGLDVSGTIMQRQNLMNDLASLRAKKTALEAQRDQITLSFGDIYSQADKLKNALASSQSSQFSGLQRMMELGEDQAPPPPAPLPTPKVVAAPAAQAPAPVAPVVDNQPYQQDVIDSYGVISDAFGSQISPGFPIPRTVDPGHHNHDSNGRGHDGNGNGDDGHGHNGNHDHDHDHDHGTPTPTTPTPPTGNVVGTPGAPYVGPSKPTAPASPAAPVTTITPGPRVVGTPGNNSVTPGPRNSSPPSSQRPQPTDPNNDAPQGGRHSPYSNGP